MELIILTHAAKRRRCRGTTRSARALSTRGRSSRASNAWRSSDSSSPTGSCVAHEWRGAETSQGSQDNRDGMSVIKARTRRPPSAIVNGKGEFFSFHSILLCLFQFEGKGGMTGTSEQVVYLRFLSAFQYCQFCPFCWNMRIQYIFTSIPADTCVYYAPYSSIPVLSRTFPALTPIWRVCVTQRK